jgi:glycosyltransferase involved in cell wall biosynthesis
LENEVSVLGRKSNPYRYLARSDIFVMPSYYEGFPNALAEALICRLACVAYRFKAGAIDLLGDNAAGTLVPVGDIAALANAIENAENKSANAQISSVQELVRAYEKVFRTEAADAP